MKKNRVGRPKIENSREHVLSVRITKIDKLHLKSIAAKLNMKLSNLYYDIVSEAVKKHNSKVEIEE
jgi:hypothetical protein